MSRSLFVLAMCNSALLLAQTSGTISGTVTDSSGAAVPQANIAAINATTAERRETNASAAGRYAFPLLAPGDYRIEVSSASAQIGAYSYVLMPSRPGNPTQRCLVEQT